MKSCWRCRPPIGGCKSPWKLPQTGKPNWVNFVCRKTFSTYLSNHKKNYHSRDTWTTKIDHQLTSWNIIDYHWLSLIIIDHHWLSLIIWKLKEKKRWVTTWNKEMLASASKNSFWPTMVWPCFLKFYPKMNERLIHDPLSSYRTVSSKISNMKW